MTLKGIALGLVAAVGISTAAYATDLYVAPTSPVMAAPEPGFDYDGVYLGVLGGGYYENGGWGISVSKVLGFNYVTSGGLLLGVEGEALYLNYQGTSYYFLGARGRLGMVLDSDTLIYASGGAGRWNTSGVYPTVGAGFEHAVGDNLAVRGDVQALLYGGSDFGFFARAGVVWYAN